MGYALDKRVSRSRLASTNREEKDAMTDYRLTREALHAACVEVSA